jgi:alanyl-tRNA synthetase
MNIVPPMLESKLKSMLTGSQIRRKFLDFFVQKGHREVHSSSLVPHNDPTLLFTNAGMNQFKDVFLGLEKRDYARATSSQKCVRAGGKHNDLENVGFTNRHHTFFEMLGNFSFGDYFKKDAIAYAWELITSPEWFGIPKDKLYVTVFNGEGGVPRDAEAYDLWLAQGVSKDRIFEFGLKDNFWQMGDTGPCGPCSEIHYDMGPAASDQGHTDCAFGCDCGRYVEIWNLVFMQFDRDASGKLNPLPKPSIDTGMGLERVTAVLQGVISNYATDLFVPLIERAAELTGASRGHRGGKGHVGTGASHVQAEQSSADSGAGSTSTARKSGASLRRTGEGTRPHVDSGAQVDAAGHKSAASLRVIADHSRAATFLISDGVLPSNEGRGYVLRKIIRRAITHGRLLGQTKPFLHEMVFAVRDLMQDAYPELNGSPERVYKAVLAEEQRFAHTMSFGIDRLREEATHPRVERHRELLDELPEPHKPITDAFGRALRDHENRGLSFTYDAIDWSILFQRVEDLFGTARAQQLRSEWERAEHIPLQLSGRQAFDVFQTYGLPRDFIEDFCRDSGIRFDAEGFDSALNEERERARVSWKGATKQTANPAYQQLPKSVFEGYLQTRSEDCEVLAIIKNGQGVQELKPGEEGEVILDHTPFYAESGGQVGDRGYFYSDELNAVVAEVKGTYYPVQGVRAHQVVMRSFGSGKSKSPPSAKNVEGWGTRSTLVSGVPHPSPLSGEGGGFDFTLRVGNKVDAVVDTGIREATMRNHTATHLLHAGLREVLGKHVKQAGSLVAPNHLRFDFSHFTAVEDEEMQDVEDLINREVLRNQRVEVIENVPIDVAVNEYHAMALFGEKYGDRVRVVKIGDFSTELCGGTHTGATGEIGLIKILKEGSVSSGVRRVEAVTGEGSLQHFRKDHELENVVSAFVTPTFALKTSVGAVEARASSPVLSPADALKLEIEKKDAEIKRLQRELDQVRMKQASSSTANIGDKVKEVRGVKVLAHRVDNLERAQMRTLVDQLRDKIGSGIVVLGSATNGTVSLIVGVTKDLTSRIQAGKVIGPVAQKVGGKGGGRPDLAEAGGKDPAALDAALGEAYSVVEGLLG